MTMKNPSEPPVDACAATRTPKQAPLRRSASVPRLADLLAQIEPGRELSAEDKAWLNAPPVGNELL